MVTEPAIPCKSELSICGQPNPQISALFTLRRNWASFSHELRQLLGTLFITAALGLREIHCPHTAECE